MASPAADISAISEQIKQASGPFERLLAQMRGVIVGQEELLHRMCVALLANGHLLIEGVPGLAKTTAVACLAMGVRTKFQRIQFTPDMLPADLMGTQVYRPQTGEFVVQKGPLFANVILADEINRAPAKVQSALLEAMQERQVTIGKETFKLDEPFLVLATQNPLEQEGTYPLPEAQVDRFLMKVIVRYPTKQQERLILDRMASTAPPKAILPVLDPAEVLAARRLLDLLYVDERVKDYVVELVVATRDPRPHKASLASLIQTGASPRATIALTLAAKASAFLAGRGYVVPQDVKDVALDVLRHRVIVTYEAEAEEKSSDDIVKTLLDLVPVP